MEGYLRVQAVSWYLGMNSLDVLKAYVSLSIGLVIQPIIEKISINEIAVPIIGAQLTVIAAGAIGALASTVYKDPDESRSRLFGSVLVASIFGPVLAVLAIHGLEWKWVAAVPGAVAFVLSFCIRLWLQAIVARGLLIIKKANIFSWMKTDGDGS